MKKVSFQLTILACLIFSSSVRAEDSSVNDRVIQSSESVSRFLFYAGVLYAQASSPTGSLSGEGVNVRASYLPSDKFDLSLGFTQALTVAGSPTSLFSGFTSDISYSILGSQRELENTIIVDGHPAVFEKKARTWSLNAGLGFDQYWFNGSSNVYPASGLALSVSSSLPLWGIWIRPEFRVDRLTTGFSQSVTVNSFYLNFEF